MLWIFAALAFLAGLAMFAYGTRDAALGGRVRALPTSRIADLALHADSGDVKILGRIVVGQDSVFLSPLTDTPCVWCRVHREVWEPQTVLGVRNGKEGRWAFMALAIRGVPFLIDDGSGAFARIDADGALLPTLQIHLSWRANVESEAMDAFFGTASVPHTTERPDTSGLPSPGATRYVEELLAPGDPILAVGPVRRERAPESNAYRDGLALVLAASPESPRLILSSDTEARTWTHLARFRIVGAAVVVISLGVALAAFLRR